jgi:hypothetical protein
MQRASNVGLEGRGLTAFELDTLLSRQLGPIRSLMCSCRQEALYRLSRIAAHRYASHNWHCNEVPTLPGQV